MIAIRVTACLAAPLLSAAPSLAQCGWQAIQDLPAPVNSTNFGVSLGLSSTSLVIGASTSGAAGIQSGAAHTYSWTGSSWQAGPLLLPAGLGSGDNFGGSMAMDGDLLVVGSSKDAPQGSQSGSAFVFRRNSFGSWIQEAQLIGSNAFTNARFGFAVATDGGRIYVGAPRETSAGVQTGAAYVFEQFGANWAETARLTASGGGSNDFFGWDLDADGNRLLIGAYGADNPPVNSTGAAYVYDRLGSTWFETQKLVSAGGQNSDFAGWQVALAGDDALVGAYGTDGGTNNEGVVLHYALAGGAWTEQMALQSPVVQEDERFGYNLEFDGSQLFVGTRGVQGFPALAAEVYAYGFDGSSFSFLQDLGRRSAFPGGDQGSPIAYADGRLVTGALNQDAASAYAEPILSETVLLQDFDGAMLPPGVSQSTTGLWHSSSLCDPGGCFSGSRMYYGLDFSCNFDTGGPNSGTLEFAGITVGEAFDSLEIRYTSYFEGQQGCNVDRPSVRVNGVLVDDACQTIALGCETRSSVINLASFSSPLTVQWTFQSVNGVQNQGHGWSIDNIELVATDDDVPDCNGNGIADLCDITSGTSTDVNLNGVPDECEDVVSNYCGPANPNSSGGPASIDYAGSTSLAGNDLQLLCTGVGPNQFGYFIMGVNQGFTPNFAGSQGNLCLAPPFVRFNRASQGEILFSGPLGEMNLATNNGNLPNGTVWISGSTWNFQLWFRDVNPTLTSNTSDGMEVLFRP